MKSTSATEPGITQPALITALDVPSTGEIQPIVERLGAAMTWYKVGLELFCAAGYTAIKPLIEANRRVFLDLKLHDIPRTVERAVSAAGRHQVDLLTVHAAGGRAMLRAAAEAARGLGEQRPRLLAVTLLTSLDEADLLDLGIQRTPAEQVMKMAEIALECGMDGLVCSPREVRKIRDQFGPAPLLVTPGIRLPDQASGDQKRTGTPRQAMLDGASFLVVGRPILESSDPVAAAEAIRADMRGG